MRLKPLPTTLAVIKELASVSGHALSRLMAALGTGDCGVRNHAKNILHFASDRYFGHVRFGSLADKPSRAKTHHCPLLSESGQTRARLNCPLSANTGHWDKLFWTSVVIPTTCRCHHSACACAVSGAVMLVPCGLTTVYPLIDRTCSRVKPWPELPSCTSQLLPPTWLISTNT
jgi:hypothetical protein